MSMIRAAGRERDLPKALFLLSELEELPRTVDVAAYNWAIIPYHKYVYMFTVLGEESTGRWLIPKK